MAGSTTKRLHFKNNVKKNFTIQRIFQYSRVSKIKIKKKKIYSMTGLLKTKQLIFIVEHNVLLNFHTKHGRNSDLKPTWSYS